MQGAEKAGKPPISTHPLFPAIVALWFAALLGLGSLVLPSALLERAAMATGIATIIPAAAPPFGLTARILIALAGTLAGIVIGLVIARRVASAHASKPAPRFSKTVPASPTPRPINAHEELGHEGFDGNGKPGRRRTLAIHEDDSPSEYLDHAPLPGAQELSWPAGEETIQAEEPLELSTLAENKPAEDPQAEDPAQDFSPVQDDDGAARLQDDPLTVATEEPATPQAFDPPAAMETEASDEVHEPEETERQLFIRGEPEESEPEMDSAATVPEAETGPEHESAFEPAAQGDPEPAPEPAEPLPFSPPSLAREKQLETAPAHNDGADEPEQPQEEAYPAGEEMAETDMSEEPKTDRAKSDWSETPPEELGLVQLAQRLGSAIEKHREFVLARAAAEPAPERNVPADFDMAEPDEAALAKAAYFGGETSPDRSPEQEPAGEASETAEEEFATHAAESEDEEERQVFQPKPAPAAAATPPAAKPYQPFAGFAADSSSSEYGSDEHEEDEVEELAASFSLPIDRKTSRPLFADEGEPVEEAESESDSATIESPTAEPAVPQGYGSLLGIKNPFKEGGEKFVRVDEEEFDTHESGDAFEPAVIFPGQEERPRGDAPMGENDAAKTGAARPFDPPREAAQPKRPAAPQAGSNDTDEMLREALLNLQRTSGAA